jgi:hypothetical protein
MVIKKTKKRASNGISSLHGNKGAKEDQKEHAKPMETKPAPSKKEASAKKIEQPILAAPLSREQKQPAPLVITVKRHEYPALKSVLGSHAFYTQDGRELRNLLDMAHAFEEMAEDTFRHHVGDGYNHFSNWLNDCFQLSDLAESIKSSTKAEAHTKVIRHLLHEVLK